MLTMPAPSFAEPPVPVASEAGAGTGLLEFSMPGEDGACTAAVIDRRLLVTAGHCVYDPDTRRFYGHFRFMPAAFDAVDAHGAEDLATPLGSWVVTKVAITAEWRRGDYRGDLAVLLVADQTARGGAIGDVVGHYRLARSDDVPDDAAVTVLGYPDNLNPGLGLYALRARTWIEPRVGFEDPYPLRAAPASFGGGASGGPWLTGMDDPEARSEPARQISVVGITSTGGRVDDGSAESRLYSSLIGDSMILARDALCAEAPPRFSAQSLPNCYDGH